MSKPSNLLFVKTESKPFGVLVKWKWPDGSHWGNSLELQYLFGDGRLEKEVIKWPVSGKLIAGLKAGEHLQIRLRLTDKDGYGCNWSKGDWIEGVASEDASEYLAKVGIQVSQKHADNVELSDAGGRDAVQAIVGRYLTGEMSEYAEDMIDELMALREVSAISGYGFNIRSGYVFINDAFIADAIQSSNFDLDAWCKLVASRLDQQALAIASQQASIGEMVKEAIRAELRPGGQLFKH